MEKELTKLYLNDMSQLKMYQLFGLRKVMKLASLTAWLTDLPELNHVEEVIAKHYQGRLLKNIDAWNGQELSLNFIGPIFASIDFTVLNKIITDDIFEIIRILKALRNHLFTKNNIVDDFVSE